MSDMEQSGPKRLAVDNVTEMIRAEAFYRIMTCHAGKFQNWLNLLNCEAQEGAFGMSAGAAALTAIDVHITHEQQRRHSSVN